MFDVKKMGEQIASLRIRNKYTQEQLYWRSKRLTAQYKAMHTAA